MVENDFAVIFTMFNPEPEHLRSIKRLADSGVNVIVVDNSLDDNIRFESDDPFLGYYKNHNNGGIAGALNKGIDLARAGGIKYVIFLDQDSTISSDAARELLSIYKEIEYSGRRAIVGASYFDKNLGANGVCCRLTKFGYKRVNDFDASGFAGVSFLITAGTCISVDLIDKIGYFDEDLFIDHVDTEHSLRSVKFGVDLILTNKVTILHSVGFRESHKLFGFLPVRPNNHSGFRRYFIFRNNIYILKKNWMLFPGFIVLSLARMAHEILSIVFFEGDKAEKIKYVCVGVLHGMVGKMGPMEK